jgi:hypothetical protein
VNGCFFGRNEEGGDLYEGGEGAGELKRVIEGGEKMGVPITGAGGGRFRGKSRPCLYRF